MTWELRQGDCLDPLTGLASLADRSVDHVITDPPYDEHTHTRQRKGVMADGRMGHGICLPRGIGFTSMTSEGMVNVAIQIGRVVRRWAAVFCAIEQVSEWRAALEEAGLRYMRTGVWRKRGGAPQFTGDRPAVAVEAIVFAHVPGRRRWNGGGRQGIWDVPIIGGAHSDRVHTTQKPLQLMAALVADFTDRGELICDPFAGSGTTGVAAIRAGRRFVGWELDATYHETARRRLAETREQAELPGLAGPKAEQLALVKLGG